MLRGALLVGAAQQLAIAQSNIMDRIFEGSLVQQQLKLLCHQAMTGEAIVNGPNYRSSLSFPIRFLKRSMFSHNYFSFFSLPVHFPTFPV